MASFIDAIKNKLFIAHCFKQIVLIFQKKSFYQVKNSYFNSFKNSFY